MYMPDVEWHETATLDEATALLGRLGFSARVVAGGTDLLVDLKTGRAAYKHLVALPRMSELRELTSTPDGLRIGAATTITELIRSPAVRNSFAPLLDAATKMAAPPIRNAATLGGNIASAVPCADMPPVLMVMGAEVVLRSASGERRLALRDFFRGPRLTALRGGEILTGVLVPPMPPGFGVAYERFGLREGNAIAVAAVAAAVQLDHDDTMSDASMALGAVSPVPKMVEGIGDTLAGWAPGATVFTSASSQSPEPSRGLEARGSDFFADVARMASEAAEPISDVRGSAEFRRHLVGVLARRALAKACRRARENRS